MTYMWEREGGVVRGQRQWVGWWIPHEKQRKHRREFVHICPICVQAVWVQWGVLTELLAHSQPACMVHRSIQWMQYNLVTLITYHDFQWMHKLQITTLSTKQGVYYSQTWWFLFLVTNAVINMSTFLLPPIGMSRNAHISTIVHYIHVWHKSLLHGILTILQKLIIKGGLNFLGTSRKPTIFSINTCAVL